MMRHFSFILFVFLSFLATQVKAEDLSSGHALLNEIEKRMLDDVGTAEKLLRESLTSKDIRNSDWLKSHRQNLLGLLSIFKSDFPAALDFFERARDLATKSGNQVQRAESYRREGLVYFILEQYPKALALYMKSMELHLDIGSSLANASITNIINIYQELNQFEKQMEYSWLLLEEAIKHNDYNNIAAAHNYIALVFINRQEFEQARYHLDQELKAHQQLENPFMIVNYYGYGKLALAERKLEEAINYIEDAKTFIEERSFDIALPSVLLLESDIRLALGQTELAIQLLNKAIFLSEEADSSNGQIKALHKLTDIYHSIDDFEQAYKAMSRIDAIKTSGQLNVERQLLAVNQAQLDIDIKNRQINQLTIEKEANAERLNQQIFLLVFAIVVIGLLTFFTFRLNQQKKMLRDTSSELQRATEAKSNFVARMSHEIRTPINAIIGLTKLSLRSSEDQQQATNLKQIEESSHTLLGLINDILDISKIEAGKMSLEAAPFGLDEVIDSSIRMNAVKANEKGLDIVKFVGPNVPLRVKGDALRLQQILNNLLSNAVKFTDEGSISVVVNREYSEHHLRLKFEIKDTGRGISNTQKALLFQSFSQADESITRKYGGTGLGLAISKQLVELMSGEIWVESVPSQGATFIFTLQLEVDDSEQTTLSRTQRSTTRVLVIDDKDDSSLLIQQMLNRMDISSEIASNGHEGVDKMRKAIASRKPYDLVIVDWLMEDIDGIEVASIIRQSFNLNTPKIILMASRDIDKVKQFGEPLGIECYLPKPLNASALYNCIVGTPCEASARINTANLPMRKAPNWSGVNILLVEDNALNRKVAIGYLQETKATIHTAENGQQAIQKLKNTPSVDIILMDIQMPEMDGLTASEIIRHELKSSVPIIAMTAHAIDEDIQKSQRAGMDAHVIKPIDPDTLISKIGQYLSKNQE